MDSGSHAYPSPRREAVPGNSRVHGSPTSSVMTPTRHRDPRRFRPAGRQARAAADRQQNVRRAFRSFPLHELPLEARTINPFTLYENQLAGGRVMLLPTLAVAAGRAARARPAGAPPGRSRNTEPSGGPPAGRSFRHVLGRPADHRMRSLFSWVRSGCEPVRCGVPRVAASHRTSLDNGLGTHGIRPGLHRGDPAATGSSPNRSVASTESGSSGWRPGSIIWLDLRRAARLPGEEIPFLANRGGEALRALVAACILDHNDIATLAARSIEGEASPGAASRLGGCDDSPYRASRSGHQPSKLLGTRCTGVGNPWLTCSSSHAFPPCGQAAAEGRTRHLHRHRRVVSGAGSKIVLGQGARLSGAGPNARRAATRTGHSGAIKYLS